SSSQAHHLLRHRCPGRDHSSGPHRRADGASISEPPCRTRAGAVSAPVTRADSEADAGRAAVSGTIAAHRHGGGGVYGWTGGGIAARAGLQTIGTADEAGGSAVARGN